MINTETKDLLFHKLKTSYLNLLVCSNIRTEKITCACIHALCKAHVVFVLRITSSDNISDDDYDFLAAFLNKFHYPLLHQKYLEDPLGHATRIGHFQFTSPEISKMICDGLLLLEIKNNIVNNNLDLSKSIIYRRRIKN